MRTAVRKALRVRLGNQRGVALIVVLWIFIFLFVVAFDFSATVREEAAATHRFSDETQGYYLALAGFQRGLYDFIQQAGGGNPQADAKQNDLFDGSWREEKLGSGMFRVRLVDEGGKINLNRVDEQILRRVLTNLGVEGSVADILADSIMDWRDPDDLHRTNGAESDYYSSLSPAYTAKNGPLDSVEDLLWIRGMTPALFYGSSDDAGDTRSERAPRVGLRDVFTIDSPIDRVNLRTATAEVIHALTGIPMDKCRNFVEERKRLSEKTMTDLLPLLGIGSGDTALQSIIFTNPSVVAVDAEGRPTDARAARRVKGVVRLGGAQGFEILRWLDREIGLSQP
jgi:general secretion pathway protein K